MARSDTVVHMLLCITSLSLVFPVAQLVDHLQKMDELGIDPNTSCMLNTRSTI